MCPGSSSLIGGSVVALRLFGSLGRTEYVVELLLELGDGSVGYGGGSGSCLNCDWCDYWIPLILLVVSDCV